MRAAPQDGDAPRIELDHDGEPIIWLPDNVDHDTMTAALEAMAERSETRHANGHQPARTPHHHDEDGRPIQKWWADPPDLDSLPPERPPLVGTVEGQPLIVSPHEGAKGLCYAVYGNMEAGKSFIAQAASAIVAAHDGARVAYADAESDDVEMFLRWRLLGAYSPHGGVCADTDRFRYVEGSDIAELEERDDSAEYASWFNHRVQPFLGAGINVLLIDHDIRSRAGQKDRAQHGPFGTATKGNTVQVLLQVVSIKPWDGERTPPMPPSTPSAQHDTKHRALTVPTNTRARVPVPILPKGWARAHPNLLLAAEGDTIDPTTTDLHPRPSIRIYLDPRDSKADQLDVLLELVEQMRQ